MSEIKIEQRRLFDWRLVISLILAGLLMFGGYAAVKAFQASDRKDTNTTVALSEVAKAQAQVREVIVQLQERDAEIKAQAAASQANAAVFASNQAAMLRFQTAEIAWTRRILAFIRTHPGQPIPVQLLVTPTPPKLKAVAGAPKAAKRHGKAKPKG